MSDDCRTTTADAINMATQQSHAPICWMSDDQQRVPMMMGITDLGVLSHWSNLESTCIASLPQAHSEGRFLLFFSSLQLAVRSTEGSPPGSLEEHSQNWSATACAFISNLWFRHHIGLPTRYSSSILPYDFPSSSVSDRPYLSTISFYQSPERLTVSFFIPITSVSFHFIHQST